MNCCVYCMSPLPEGGRVCPNCGRTADYVPPVHHLKPGTVLREKYLIGRALGEGGFGITYIGRDTTLDMRVAVKEYYPNGFSNRDHNHSNQVTLTQKGTTQNFEQEMQRFLHEARTLAKFSDEQGIVGVRDFFRENGTAYIVMDYLDGITLKNYIQENGPIQAGKLFAMMDPVLVSLNRIHQEGLIHRDISPDNIMVLKNGQLKLLDFGAAREVSGDKSLSVMLKPGYAPEEQYRSKGKQGPWTDVYAMCATMYKCMTGVTPDESLERAYDDSLQLPSKLGAVISPAQEAALMKGLRVKASERTQDIETLRRALNASDDEAPVQTVFLQRQSVDDEEKTIYARETTDDNKTIFQPENKSERTPVEQSQSSRENRRASIRAEQAEKKSRHKNTVKKKQASSEADSSPKGKKRKSVLLALGCVAAVLVIAILALVFRGPEEVITSIPGDNAYSLVSVGQIEDQERLISISQNVLSRKTGNETIQMLDCMGNDLTDGVYEKVKYLGYGIYEVRGVSNEVNSVGVVNTEGKVLIPTEACGVEWPYMKDEGNCRYLVVYYATEEVSENDDFMFCVTEDGSVYTTNVGGRLFEGYSRIFDLKKNQFVGDLNLPFHSDYVQICGDNIVAGKYGEGFTLYDPKGNVLMQSADDVHVGDGTIVINGGGTYRVYDENGTQTYSANKNISLVGHSQYIKMKSGEQYIVMDRNGNQVLPGAYDDIRDENNNIFVVSNDRKQGLVSIDGTEIVPCMYDYVSELFRSDMVGGGFYYGKNGSDHSLICKDGVVMTDVSSAHSKMILFKDGNGLVINNRSYDLNLNGARYDELTYAMISVSSTDTGLYGVYDLFTGQQLLPFEYDMIRFAAGYLYAYRYGTWSIYQVNGPA